MKILQQASVRLSRIEEEENFSPRSSSQSILDMGTADNGYSCGNYSGDMCPTDTRRAPVFSFENIQFEHENSEETTHEPPSVKILSRSVNLKKLFLTKTSVVNL